MSSNSAEEHRHASWFRRLGRRLQPASITTKLALSYALLTFAVLLVATVVLYWAVVVSLAHDDQRFLSEKVHVLRTMLAERANDKDLLREEVDWETRVIGHARYFVQILNHRNRVVIQTPGLDHSGIDEHAFPPPIPAGSTEPRMRWVHTANGRRYLLSAAVAPSAVNGEHIVRLAVDVSHEGRILGDFRRIAGLVLLTGVLLSGLLGALVAHYGLRPLGGFAKTVAETTALRLDQRVDPAMWPAEFAYLATAFNRLLEHLQDAFTRLSDYTANMAHELRTPINNLMGETEVILARNRAGEDYRQTLISNLEEYQRLARMIESLLFLARTESGDAHRTRRRFDAAQALQEVVDYYRPAAEEAGVTLTCTGASPLTADRDLFRRAVSNLLDNAIRHSIQGGQVSVSVHGAREGAVSVQVQDTGCGIAEADRNRVFDRFFRSPASRTDASGSGLGLAIVQSIMRLHNGHVGLTSEPGGGTTVTLSFPPAATG